MGAEPATRDLDKPRRAARRPARRDLLPSRSAWFARGFDWYVSRYLRRHFHAVRCLRPVPATPAANEPLVVFMNHPGWWDPLVAWAVHGRWLPGRTAYAPIDAAMLRKYRFFGRLGFFGVEQGSARGAREFLDTSLAVLAEPATALWLTPQGTFADPRERPVEFKPGLAALARRMTCGRIWPVAVEYPFWTERRPEALLAIGEPLDAADWAHRAPDELAARLASALEAAQDRLAAAALRRDPREFVTLVSGASGVHPVYDLWRRCRAAWRGEAFSAAHGDEP